VVFITAELIDPQSEMVQRHGPQGRVRQPDFMKARSGVPRDDLLQRRVVVGYVSV